MLLISEDMQSCLQVMLGGVSITACIRTVKEASIWPGSLFFTPTISPTVLTSGYYLGGYVYTSLCTCRQYMYTIDIEWKAFYDSIFTPKFHCQVVKYCTETCVRSGGWPPECELFPQIFMYCYVVMLPLSQFHNKSLWRNTFLLKYFLNNYYNNF